MTEAAQICYKPIPAHSSPLNRFFFFFPWYLFILATKLIWQNNPGALFILLFYISNMGKVYPFCHRIASFQHASQTESHPILFKNRGGDNARLKWIQLRFAEGKFLFDRTKFTTTASAAHYQQQFRRLLVVPSKIKNSNNKTNQAKEKGKKGRGSSSCWRLKTA